MTQPVAEVAAPPPLAPARPWHPAPGPCPSSTRDEGLESTKTLSPPRRGKPCSYTQPWLNQEDGHSLSLQLQGSRPPCYGFLIWVPASPQHRRAFPSPSPVPPPASGIPAASRHGTRVAVAPLSPTLPGSKYRSSFFCYFSIIPFSLNASNQGVMQAGMDGEGEKPCAVRWEGGKAMRARQSASEGRAPQNGDLAEGEKGEEEEGMKAGGRQRRAGGGDAAR